MISGAANVTGMLGARRPGRIRRGWSLLAGLWSGAGAAMGWILIALIRGYQRLISPLLGPRCRFFPSCSSYAVGCIQRYGVFKGLAKAIWRLARCHPFCKGGFDPP